MLNSNRVKSWISKQYEHLIEEVDEDAEVVEALLKEGYTNSEHLETMWVFGKDRYLSGSYTLKQVKADLVSWLSYVKPDAYLV